MNTFIFFFFYILVWLLSWDLVDDIMPYCVVSLVDLGSVYDNGFYVAGYLLGDTQYPTILSKPQVHAN
jgi:hypothetical protein